MSNKTIPFGKYRGQPVEILISDKSYFEWLQNQDWFRTKFEWIIDELYGIDRQSEQTPVHNIMQAKFLDQEFVCSLLRRCYEYEPGDVKFEKMGWDVVVKAGNVEFEYEDGSKSLTGHSRTNLYIELKPVLADDYPVVLRQMKKRMSITEFEPYGQNVCLLIIGKFDTVGVSYEDVMKIFSTSKITLITL